MDLEKVKEKFEKLYKQSNSYAMLPGVFKLKSDNPEVLDQHYYLLKSEKNKNARRTLKHYFT